MIARVKRIALLALGAALTSTAFSAAPASAEFGLTGFDVEFLNRDGSAATQAGSHPYAQITTFEVNSTAGVLDGKIKDFRLELLTGFIGDGTLPRCSTADFLAPHPTDPEATNRNACPDAAAIGVAEVDTFIIGSPFFRNAAVYNLVPPPGAAARIGFKIRGVPAVVDVAPKEDPEYNIVASSLNISSAVPVLKVGVMLWGVPADPAHDFHRAECLTETGSGEFVLEGGGETCPTNATPQPFLTLPRSCDGPIQSTFEAVSWEGAKATGGIENHDSAEPPNTIGFTGCAKLGFDPTITSAPTTRAAQSPTGLDFTLDIEDDGLSSPTGLAESEIKKAVVTLPEGVTANPSIAEGLEVCTEEDLEDETANSAPGEGCPEASKLGTVEVESPLIDENVDGALYIAEPFKNRLGSLIALYIVIKNPRLGIIVKNRLKVEPDPETGQLVTIVEDIPQLPFSHFRLHFREGARSPLSSPSACGDYEVKAELTPWAGGAPITTTSSFKIISGPNNGPCPPPGKPPFEPGFGAGSLNNSGGSYSPFTMRLTRRDGDQDLTRFDATLPPGMLGKLAGVSWCPEAAIAQAKTKTGLEELASPSCPANSKIGRSVAGAGVGSQITYVPGSIYLAGPFGKAPLSVVAITPAVAGPFDVGTVVVRQALTVHPRTAEVRADGALSDPIPHILEGIPLTVRDIRVYVDRPDFTLNPTSCDPYATSADIWGGGSQLFTTADDAPVARSARFQAANCSRLGFKPRLSFKLNGGTKRGSNPALRAVLRPRPGDANIETTVVRLPRSAFLDQAHIRTICTRVQYAADACPKGAVYGRVRAFTPLLDDPLEGPAYLRSSDNELPDLVFDLHGLVDVESSARIDSIRGGIRATFAGIPDAPLTKVVVSMQGGQKGLIINSRDLCASKSKANVRFDAHNGKRVDLRPVVRADCSKGRKAKRPRR